MKIAHFVFYGPKRSGLYETTRELCKGEMDLGHDARLIDTSWCQEKTPRPDISKLDRGVEVAPVDWGFEADVHVLHSMIPPELYGKKPIVVVCHGAPEYVFYSELLLNKEGDRGFSTLLAYGREPDKVNKFVTMWPRHLPFWRAVFGDKRVEYVPACADFQDYKPEGPLHPFKMDGCPNIGFCDTWRPTFFKDPYQIIVGVREYWKRAPEARLQMFAIPSGAKRDVVWDRYIKAIQAQGNFLGEIWELHPKMDTVFRALDMIVTTTVDASRVIRECLACGTPVIAPTGCPYTDYTADLGNPAAVADCIQRCMEDLERDAEEVKQKCTETARKHFSLADTAERLIKIYEDVLRKE